MNLLEEREGPSEKISALAGICVITMSGFFYIGEIRKAKPGLDVIDAYVPTDDNGLLRETHQRTERGDAVRAKVSVMIPEALAFAFEALRLKNDNSRKKCCISRREGPNVRFCHYNDLAKAPAV